MESEKEIHPLQEKITITLTREQWDTICCHLENGENKAHANMVWYRDFCDDKKEGAKIAVRYEKAREQLESLRQIIEAVLYPQPAPATEE